MSNSVLTALVVVLALLTLVSLTLSVVAYRALRTRRTGSVASPLPTDVQGLRDEVERLRTETTGALRHLAVVRYDAFGDMGGRLSWSMALVDEGGNGMVLTSIHGRSDARTYAKDLAAWAGTTTLSPEEEEAVTQAKAR
ncbi:MAG: no significant homology Putative N-terminal signal sequence was found by PSORT [uncultured Nocardioidaceae bacterium]|uniref:No significant homology Putative N-terminal signal sequence was found by PSORT n=1 Tax=uncultured Nocardioidaceae bacterium TaxID=253824 RepID=A0A6J4NRU9_9ACTN|nr:MAG: no significant homology Putative N-terminal signal sequence was found by PSORT [uncultured Nocardioidaceae bacterium]